MCAVTGISVFFVLAAAVAGITRAEERVADYELLYHLAVESYLGRDWEQCVGNLNDALAAYGMHVGVVVSCRRTCRVAESESGYATVHAFYIARAAEVQCLRKCSGPWRDFSISEATLRDFRERTPYNYLQKCYFELGDTKAAASAAYTFLEHNPGHSLVSFHLSQHLEDAGLSASDVVSLEPLEYKSLFREAVKLYAKKEYSECAGLIERVVLGYLEAEENCRTLCDDFVPGGIKMREFSEIAAGHFAAALKCKRQCPHQLSFLAGRQQTNFFAGLYHYLQYLYYHLGELQKACEATQSYLLLLPDDADMWYNQAFYARLPNTQDSWFTARREVVDYVKRQERDEEALRAIELMLNTTTAPAETKANTKDHPSFDDASVRVVQDQEALNGTRFVAEGFITENECSSLLALASAAVQTGDGYDGKTSPHSKFETFQGITAGRIALLMRNGSVERELAELFLDASDRVRSYVESYFEVPSHLYFSYTHLVCRTAMADTSSGARNDMSHSVHADNCILQKTGDCLKQLPAYIWRDYSSVLYLNDDFEGGEFVFAKNKSNIEVSVKPKCGRVVAFSAGAENLHGVLPVERGRRCALATWYTLDPKYREREREFALKVISNQSHLSASHRTLASRLKERKHSLAPPTPRIHLQKQSHRVVDEL